MIRYLLLIFFAGFSQLSFTQSNQNGYSIIPYENYKFDYLNSNLVKLIDFYNSDSVYVRYPLHMRNEKLSSVPPLYKSINYWKVENSIQSITIYTYDTESYHELKIALNNELKISFTERPSFNSFQTKLNLEQLTLLMQKEEVKFIVFDHPEVQTTNFVGRTNHRISELASNFPFSSTLTGKNIGVGEWDGGTVGVHIDLEARLTIVKPGPENSHATHVAGTVCAGGNLEPLAMGMAPEAKLFSWNFNNDIPLEMDTNKKKYGYVITTNSYGYWDNNCANFAVYDATSYDMDLLSLKHKDLLHVFAAGNSRGMNCIAGGYKTLLPGFQSAKNTMSVAAIDYIDGEAGFSSAGPTQDGRFKPEISAVGVNVYSTQTNNNYSGGWSGTSMACPGASGTIALLYEKFKNKYGVVPLNFLGKNIISNSADDIGNVGPDFKSGFGRINGAVGVSLIDSGFWNIDSVSNGNYYYDTIYLPSNLHQLKVMLTWNDKEVSPTSNPKLYNNLDLTVTDSNGVLYRPWWCNPNSPTSLAIRQIDSANNIEQVTITNPIKGRYIFKVHGKKIVSGNQPFAVTYLKIDKGIKVVYPNGNETMIAPSNAASAQVIRWDVNGIAGNFNVDFSKDKGKTWVRLATNLPNTQKYYNWQNLADTVTTSKALIKVSSGTSVDSSNNPFFITGIVTGVTTLVCDSQVFLKWRTSPNTQFYRVYMLKNGKMTEMGTPADTSFLIASLKNNSPYWFSISRQAKNGAESIRTRAISATPLATNKPPKITIQPNDVETCYTNLVFSKSTSTGTPALTKIWEYTTNNGNTWLSFANANDSINLKSFLSLYKYKVRRKYTNVCQAPVYSREALINLDSLLVVNFINRDSTVCFGNFVQDSLTFKSKIKPIISWYNDTAGISLLLKSGFEASNTTNVKSPKKIWAKVENLCGFVNTLKLSNPSKTNGLNEYNNFPKPTITIKDTLLACVGEKLLIKPTLSGGKPGLNTLIIDTDDSSSKVYSLTRKITYSQKISFRLYDFCFPDTIKKSIWVEMRKPLSVKLNKDSTICYFTNATLNAKAFGGNGNYIYTWNDIGTGSSARTEKLTLTKLYKVTVTDNCTEKSAKDSTTISVLPSLSLKVTSNFDTLCWGNVLKLNTSVSGGRTSTRNINWENAFLTGYSPSLIPIKNDWYVATLSDGCSPDIKDSMFIAIRDALTIKINPMDTLCSNKKVNLIAQYSGGLPNKQFITWTPMNSVGNSIEYTPNITQIIKATISDGCSVPSVSDSLRINMHLPLQLTTIKDTSTCFGNDLKLRSVYLNGKTGTQQLFWNKILQTNFLVDSFTSKKYEYSVVDGCKDTITKFVNVIVSPKLSISPLAVQKCSYADKNVVFTTSALRLVEIKWDKLPSGPNQILKDKFTTKHIVVLSDNCSDTTVAEILVKVSDFTYNNLKLEKIINKQVIMKAKEVFPFSSSIIWKDGSQTNHSDSLVNHFYNSYGTFTICRILQDNIGCVDSICTLVSNNDPANFRGFTFNLYPNPTSGNVTIQLNQLTKDLQIEIYDIYAKLIFKKAYLYPAENETNLQLDWLANGIYLIKVLANGEIKTFKVVKE